MDKIVKASRLQILGLFIGLTLISGLVDMVVHIGLLPVLASDVLYFFTVSTIIGWILITGTMLEYKKHSSLRRLNYRLFITIGLLLIGIITIIRFLSLPETITNNNIIQIVIIVYVFTSFSWIASFTAIMLKRNETIEEIDINDYFGDILLIILWPIGVWIIQPRVNKIFEATDKVKNLD